MDKGAHYFRCDFQVHTPRDANWAGGDAVTDSERKGYAEELVLACRKKGLGAIAITDHHDFAFFPYVKKAAREELDDAGHAIPVAKRLGQEPCFSRDKGLEPGRLSGSPDVDYRDSFTLALEHLL